jgi:hypothetical protein
MFAQMFLMLLLVPPAFVASRLLLLVPLAFATSEMLLLVPPAFVSSKMLPRSSSVYAVCGAALHTSACIQQDAPA